MRLVPSDPWGGTSHANDQADVDATEARRQQRENAAIRGTGASLEASIPNALDRAMIAASLEHVHPQVMACRQAEIAGRVSVHVRVTPDGRPGAVVVVETPDANLGGCVAAAVQQATFPPTRRGGAFRYPIAF